MFSLNITLNGQLHVPCFAKDLEHEINIAHRPRNFAPFTLFSVPSLRVLVWYKYKTSCFDLKEYPVRLYIHKMCFTFTVKRNRNIKAISHNTRVSKKAVSEIPTKNLPVSIQRWKTKEKSYVILHSRLRG